MLKLLTNPLVTFEKKDDRKRKIRVLYNDSTKNEAIYFKYFFSGDTMDGPCYAYSFGKLRKKGFMKNNKRNGEELTYDSDSVLIHRAFYNEGKKIGIWETYTSSGHLTGKTYYDANGHFLKRELFDQKEKLTRTEYEEKTY